MKRAVLSACALWLLWGCGPGARQGPLEIKIGHVLPPEHASAVAVQKFAGLIEQKTGGAIEVAVYPSGQLGQEKDLAEQVQMGSLKAARLSASVLEIFVPEMKVHSLPYLYRDDGHKRQVLDGPLGREILDAGLAANLAGVLYFDSGYRSFYTQKPVRAPADLAGVRCRIQNSPMMRDVVRHLGASPQVVNWNELYTALAQGAVDAGENNIPTLYYSRHYEICKHYDLTEHVGTPDVVVFNAAFWKGLPEQHKQRILEAAREAADFHWLNWNRQCRAQLEEMKQKGLVVHDVDKAAFVQAVQPIYEQIKGTRIGDLAERIRAVR